MRSILRALLVASLASASIGCGSGDRTGIALDGAVASDAPRSDADAVDAGTVVSDGGAVDAGPTDRPEDYPEDPFAGLTALSGTPPVYRGTSTFGDGAGLFLVWAPPDYTRDRQWPLIVYLHGGGNATDTAESLASGEADLGAFVRSDGGSSFVWMAAVVRVSGSYHAWGMEQNALDMIDGVREVNRLFRVDDTRTYLTGTSMGGGGVATLSWILPHAFAAFGPVVGYYWNDILPAPDLGGVPYRILAGALDTPPSQPFDRLGLAREFSMLCETAGASVELLVMDGVGHSYPFDQIGMMNTFFLAHSLATPTDWEAARADADAILPLFAM